MKELVALSIQEAILLKRCPPCSEYVAEGFLGNWGCRSSGMLHSPLLHGAPAGAEDG